MHQVDPFLLDMVPAGSKAGRSCPEQLLLGFHSTPSPECQDVFAQASTEASTTG